MGAATEMCLHVKIFFVKFSPKLKELENFYNKSAILNFVYIS